MYIMYMYIYVYIYIHHVYVYIYSSVQPLRSVGRSNFDKGTHSLTTLIKKNRHILMKAAILLYGINWTINKKH